MQQLPPGGEPLIQALLARNQQRLQPEAMQGLAQPLVQALLGAAPGAGDVMAAQDSQRAGQMMAQALRGGDYGRAASSGLEALAHGLGALPMVPALAGAVRDVEFPIGKFLKQSGDVPQLSRAENRALNNATDRQKWQITDVLIDDLVPSQTIIHKRGLKKHASKELAEDDPYRLPFVVKKDGRLFLRDGHHRVAVAQQQGASKTPVRFIDLDAME